MERLFGKLSAIYVVLALSTGSLTAGVIYDKTPLGNEENNEIDCLIVKAEGFILYHNDTANYYANLALEKSKLKLYKKGVLQASHILAKIQAHQSNNYKSIEIFMEVFEFLDQLKEPQYFAEAILILAELYRGAGMYDMSLNHLMKVKPILIELEDSTGLFMYYDRISAINNELDKYEESIKYADTAISYIGGKQVQLASSYSIIGANYFELGFCKKALKYQLLAYNIRIKENDVLNIPNSLINLGKVYTQLANYDKAVDYLLEAMEWGERLNHKGYQYTAAHFLSFVYKQMGKYELAFHYYSFSVKLRNVLNSEERNTRVAGLLAEHEIEQTKNENIILKKEIELNTAKLQRQRVTITSIVLTLLLISIFTVFLLRSRKRISRDKNLLSKQNDKIQELANKLLTSNNKLKELDEFKENMMNIIVHDLKNPLNNIINVSSRHSDKRKIVLMQQSGMQMLSLVLDVLDVSKYENSKITLYRSTCTLEDILNFAYGQVENMLSQKNINIKENVEKEHKMRIDRNIIERVVINLLTNAIKYSPQNSTIEISEQEENGMLKLMIKDYGPGIAKQKEDIIFSKFAQIKAKKAGIVRSTGIGLHFCKLAVEAHKGEIGFHSDVGSGAQFWIKLPLIDSPKRNQGKIAEQIVEKINKPIEKVDLKSIYYQVQRLKMLDIFEISEIKNILEEIEISSGQKYNSWIIDVKEAVYNCNSEKYYDLLN